MGKNKQQEILNGHPLRPISVALLVAFLFGREAAAQVSAGQDPLPLPVRNDVARPRGEEFLVLRH